MKFAIQHSTLYEYASPVWESFNDAHLCPVSDNFQQCQTFDLKITPESTSTLRRLDFYTNQVHYFEVLAPHKSLQVVAHSVIETFADRRDLSLAPSFGQLVGLDRDERFYDFLNSSARAKLSPLIEHEAKELIDQSCNVLSQIERIMEFVFSEFKYAPGSTQVESDVAQVFAHRRGVCQDFAHIMIAFCRVVGIPTRYVSGYFFVERTVCGSADDNTASHAWVECFLPGIGWVGYDPTHNRRVNQSYIKVAIGRDYTDVRPLAGTYRGEAVAKMEVSVTVERL